MEIKNIKTKKGLIETNNEQTPVKNAFTFAREMAKKYKWPTFVFNPELSLDFLLHGQITSKSGT